MAECRWYVVPTATFDRVVTRSVSVSGFTPDCVPGELFEWLVDQDGPTSGGALPGGLQVHAAAPGAMLRPGLVWSGRWRGDQSDRGVCAQGAAGTVQADLPAASSSTKIGPVLAIRRANPGVLQSGVDMPFPDAPEKVAVSRRITGWARSRTAAEPTTERPRR
ncbi:hypothetical protein GCM10010249_17390 [Streptomyces roseolilacinus]|uniref:Uncharacterized protein n=1 Tax=Streptomyces roseolilacinus TaxID=66904 RepID=A0A918AXZ8_9ACTN|nr:hypothetical protein GCM10010249_17390 [Streptomyces roseolilacinus]